METDEGFEYRKPGTGIDNYWGDTPGLKKALWRGHVEMNKIIRMTNPENNGTVPDDAWAFRLTQWHTNTAEQLTGLWHRTEEWYRRDGIHSGLRSVCGRVYNTGVELVGAPDMHPIGYLCKDCFGISHSDQLIASNE